MAGHHEDLKRAIRAARNRADMKSDQELALRAGVHLHTIQNWMYGKTVPRPSELAKVAQALDMSMADLMAVYEGRDPEPPSLQDAIRELAGAIETQAAAFTTLAESIEVMATSVTRRVGDGVTAFEDAVTLLRSQQPTDEGVSPDANGRAR